MVKGEGMPTYKDPYSRGNLYITFDVEFPKKFPESISKKLEKILPEKVALVKVEGEDLEEVTLTNATSFKKDEGGRKEAYEEDEENERGGGGGGCSTN